MINRKNETHDPKAKSWVESANSAETDFPIQNLPFGLFRRANHETPRIGVAVGDQILDLSPGCNCGMACGIDEITVEACGDDSLNTLMALGIKRLSALRRALFLSLRSDAPVGIQQRLRPCLLSQNEVDMLVPAEIGDYTDFYASLYHATNVGSMFRPDNPLLPNYKWVPIGYHGRASSIVPSGTPIARPFGQTKLDGASEPKFGPSTRLDYELEVGAYIAEGNERGSTVQIGDAERHIFGFCLVNDWSARDMQTWEYQPLGPFLAKNFATTISPWIVTAEALVPFRSPAFQRDPSDPKPLPYLSSEADQQSGGIDLILEVSISTTKMRDRAIAPVRLSRGSFLDMYWTMAQMLTHHASNGCNLRPGDLIASGTVSGKEKDSRGCLLELTWRGTEPLTLPTGEERKFLEDGDEVVIRAWCERKGATRIGFGECVGRIIG